MKRLLLFSLLLLGCGSSQEVFEDVSHIPREFREKPVRETPFQKKEFRHFRQWLLRIARPYFSEEILEEAKLKFDYFLSRFRSSLGEKKPQRLVQLANQILLKEGEIHPLPLEKLKKPFFAHFLPYLLKKGEGSEFTTLLLLGLLFKEMGVPFAWQTEEEKLFLVFRKKALTLQSSQFHLRPFPSSVSLSLKELKGLYCYHLGKAALFAKEHKEASKYFQLAYYYAPERAEIQKTYGALLLQRASEEEVEEGEQLLRKAFQARPFDSEIPLLLGDFYYQRRELQKAKKWYKQALKLQKSFEAYFSLARTYYQLGEREKSLSLLNALLHTNLTREEKLKIWLFRGNLYLEEGQEKKGLEDLNKALAVKKELPEAWGTLANYYFRKKQWLKALKYFRHYIQYEKDMRFRKAALAKIEVLEEKIRTSSLKEAEVQTGLEEKSAEERMEALKRIVSSQSPKKEELLWKALKDKAEGVRVLAIRYLVKLNPRHLDRLIPFLKDKSPFVRGEVLFAIKEEAREEYLPKVLKALWDPSSYVRDAALKTLQEICGEIQNFGYDPNKPPEKQKKAIQVWKQKVQEYLSQ